MAWLRLHFDVTTTLGKAMLAVLASAKVNGRKVSIAYTTGGTTCTLELAAIE